MRPVLVMCVAVCCLLAPRLVRAADAPAARAPRAARVDADSLARALAGTWVSDADSAELITIARTDRAALRVTAASRFAATGFVEGGVFTGVARLPAPGWKTLEAPRLMILKFWPLGVGHIAAQFGADLASATTRVETWKRKSAEPLLGPRWEPQPERGPGFGYVEQLPELVAQVPPEYPDWARREGLAGRVRVQALVGKDGLVKQTRVVDSVEPRLDRFAVDAVKRWRFKPALTNGRPIAVWVALEVAFPPR